MRIAFVFDRFFPEKGGESYFFWLLKELYKLGYEPHVYAESGIDSEFYRFHRVPSLFYPPSMKLLSFFFNSKRLLEKEDFPIIQGVGHSAYMNLFNPHGGVEKAYLKQEFYSIRNKGYFVLRALRRYLGFKHYLLIWIQKKQFENEKVKRIVAISPMVKSHILRWYKVEEEKIRVILNSVDLHRFSPEKKKFRKEIRERLGIKEDTVLLMFTANNFRLKGLEPLIDSVAFLKEREKIDIKLLVAGRGKRKRYERMAKKKGLSKEVIFLGPVKEIEKFYGASDIYVHPTFYDPCSLAVLEALATGLPAVTSRFNGASAVISSEKGGRIIEDPWNIKELSQAIAGFFDRRAREEAESVARGFVERFSPAYNLSEMLKVYDEVKNA